LENSPRQSEPVLRCKVAFPNADHAPTGAAQRARHKTIPRFVPLEFLSPPLGTIFWPRRMFRFWTAVPEATVHKNDDALATKSEVRSPEKRCRAPPANDVMFTKEAYHPHFSILVPARPNSGHYF
jgi:hypothetical protein